MTSGHLMTHTMKISRLYMHVHVLFLVVYMYTVLCLQSNIKFNLRLSQSFFFLKQYLHKVLFPAKSSCILSYTLNHMCKGAFFICLYLRYFTVAGMPCQDIFNSFTPSLNSALIWLVLKQVYRLFTCLKSSVP